MDLIGIFYVTANVSGMLMGGYTYSILLQMYRIVMKGVFIVRIVAATAHIRPGHTPAFKMAKSINSISGFTHG